METGIQRQRGGGRLGCLIFILLSSFFVYLAVIISPVFLSKIEFEDEMARLVSRAGGQALSVRMVTKNVREIAERHDFQIVPKSLKVTKTNPYARAPELTVEVDYFRDAHFVGYTHRFDFSYKMNTFVGSF